jgi:hypothetical protein
MECSGGGGGGAAVAYGHHGVTAGKDKSGACAIVPGEAEKPACRGSCAAYPGYRAATRSCRMSVGPTKPPSSDAPPPLPVSPHLLTWWFGVMAVGGLALGVVDRQPLAKDVFAHLSVFFAVTAAGVIMLKLVHGRPLREVMSAISLAGGCVVAIACYFIGGWFAVNLTAVP